MQVLMSLSYCYNHKQVKKDKLVANNNNRAQIGQGMNIKLNTGNRYGIKNGSNKENRRK